jgi:hypothetical protein
MEVVKLLDNYIEKLDNAQNLFEFDLEKLIEKITRVVLDKDEVVLLCLNYYNSYEDEEELWSDAEKLKAKLKYKRATIIDENKAMEEHEQREIEKLRLQVELAKESSAVHNHNINNVENKNIINNTMNISFEDARKTINDMSSLPENEIEEIQNKINAIEEIVNSKDSKSKKWTKAKEIVKWIADKGVDVGITLLPLLLKMS